MPISKRSFGVTGEGGEVILYTLANDDGMRIEVMNYGGIIPCH
jgi:Galactose mutarotase and related enzymes